MAKERARKDNQNLRRKTVLTASYVTEVAVMAGMLTALKFALSFVPNVEVVTLLIAVFSAVWGVKYSVPATIVFCLVEMAIYGIGGWVILYFIYWPLLAVVFHFALHKLKGWKALVVATAIAIVFSVFFGVLSASAETLIVIGNVSPDRLGTFFVSYYIKGLWFDLVHTVSAGASIIALFLPLTIVGEKLKNGLDKRVHAFEEEDVEGEKEDAESAVDEIEADEKVQDDTTVADTIIDGVDENRPQTEMVEDEK